MTRLASLILFAGILIFSLVADLSREFALGRVRQTRKIVFHTYFVPGYPRLPDAVVRKAFATAIQAFEDHFQIPLRHVEIREGEIPSSLAKDFRGPWDAELVDAHSPMLLRNWERRIYPRLQQDWSRDPYAPLDVVVTNIPIFVEEDHASSLELRHISKTGLISGLGHPSLVITSTFRMLSHSDSFVDRGAPVSDPADQARFLGEYLLAHELGHALLGLSDTVVDESPAIRAPASLGAARELAKPSGHELQSHCLMHTDEGGGFEAWKYLRRRPLGLPSTCEAYRPIVEAFSLRARAHELARLGHGATARRLMDDALNRASRTSQNWLVTQWSRERELFRPAFTAFLRPDAPSGRD